MENITAKIEKKTRKVFLSKSVIGNDGENLQEKLVFSFDEFVDGTARLELNRNNTQSYIMLTKVDDTYELPIRSLITKVGKLDLQLVITEGTNENEIPVFKSNVFFVIVNPSINAEIEEEEDYPQWIDVANTKLNLIDEALENVNSAIDEVENLDINASQTSTGATITITKKDSTQESVSILNGRNGTNGRDGQDAKLNGVNTLTIVAGQNITLSQSGNELEISSTGGSGGTSDYSVLTNKPSINNVTLSGNKSLSDLGIQPQGNYYTKPPTGIPSTDLSTAVQTSLGKADTAIQDITGKLDTSKVKNTQSTTSGDVYDVTYINSLIGDINTILATLTTPGGNE